MASTEESQLRTCEELGRDLAEIQDLIKKKKDVYKILEKLAINFAASHNHFCSKITKVREENVKNCVRLNTQQVEAENSSISRLTEIRQESIDKTDGLELARSCSNEGSTLLLTFVDPSEVDMLRGKTKNELIIESKKIFSRMEISLNSPNRVIHDAFLRKLPMNRNGDLKSELVLSMKFSSISTVTELKQLITKYSKRQFIEKNFDDMRYSTRDFWSPGIRNILRVCYDLQSDHLVKFVNVTDAGIVVTYESTTHDPSRYVKKLIRTESDLNELRNSLDDACPQAPTFQIYDDNYFKLDQKGRICFKDSLREESKKGEGIQGNKTKDSRMDRSKLYQTKTTPNSLKSRGG
jgi:hypothetical protein